jgi:hypothetical protein
MRRLTDEAFASIPLLIEQGMTKCEIAARYGVTVSTLQVQCSRRNISLRKGGPFLPRRALVLPEGKLSISTRALQALRHAARAMGTDEVQLASELLETIIKDDLYKAVLDVEAV